ncbi:hypothetical protein RYA05_06360 [Pseudomonas syringae pv. actinidiae]|nr:hypothetical protein [Pseudomonas syringae pv. actinidiae]
MSNINHNKIVPFQDRPSDEQTKITQALLTELEELLHQGTPEKISQIRVQMNEKFGMNFIVFQECLETLYNNQECYVGSEEEELQLKELYLTSVPISFYPDHDLQSFITIQSTLGLQHAEWAQELVSTMVAHEFLRKDDQHWVVPGLFDIDELFATPISSYNIIPDLVSARLPQKFPLKNFTLTESVPAKTLFFLIVTAPTEPEKKSAIIPSYLDSFTEFSAMKLQMEAILTHYYTKHSKKEFEANVMVGSPLPGSMGTRLRYPSTMMAHLSYYLMKIEGKLDIENTTVIIERNKKTQAFNLSVYSNNTCIMSYKYADAQLASGLEEAMMSYVLDTQGFSHYKIIDVHDDSDLQDKMKKPLIRLV